MTVELLKTNLDRILDDPTGPMVVQCTVCDAKLMKSVSCNEMSHCHRKWCAACGEQTLATENVLLDHYGASGPCCRYEYQNYYHRCGCKDYRCVEGLCYNEHSGCKVASHQTGLVQKHIFIRLRWLCKVALYG